MPKKPKDKTARPKLPQITGGIFYQYLSCPHWPYFDLYGDQSKRRRRNRFSELLLEMGVLQEERFLASFGAVSEVKAKGPKARAAATLKLMRAGAELIHRGRIEFEDLAGEPSLLEKRTDGSSDFGAYHYVPIEIKSAERLTDAHRCQLSLSGEILAGLQGTPPAEGCIWNGSGARLCFDLSEFEEEFHRLLDEIRSVIRGRKPPPQLTSGCKQSPWFDECKALAEQSDDIALLYNVKKKSLQALRDRGLRTLADVRAMKPEDLPGGSKYLTDDLLDRIKLQADALHDRRHFVRRPFALPESALEIFFDIEGDPLRQAEYLFGFLVRDRAGERYEYQLAERPEDEERMWGEFLDWTAKLDGDYVVYHYGAYETIRLDALAARFGGSPALDAFRAAMIDLNETVKESLVLPLYFYGLKDIGGYIGFERGKKISGGGESVAFYEDWLAKGDRRKLDAVLDYNRDDVVATRCLKDWLVKVCPAT